MSRAGEEDCCIQATTCSELQVLYLLCFVWGFIFWKQTSLCLLVHKQQNRCFTRIRQSAVLETISLSRCSEGRVVSLNPKLNMTTLHCN